MPPLLSVALAFSAGGVADVRQAAAEKLFNQAMEAQQRGDLAAAIDGYHRVLKLNPGLVPALANLASAQVQSGHPEEAVDTYESALQRAPGNTRLTLLLADTFISLRNYAKAVGTLEPIAKSRPSDLDVSFLLGEALIDSGKLQDGVIRVKQVAGARRDANAYVLAAIAEMKLERYQEAVQSADAAASIDPALPGVYTLAGMAKARAGDNEGAMAAYRRALDVNSEDFDANLRFGTILLRIEDDPDRAKPYLEKALELNPSSLPARFEAGKLQMANHNDAAAIASFESIVAQNNRLLEPHLQLAILYGREKRREDSERHRKIVDQLKAENAGAEALEP